MILQTAPCSNQSISVHRSEGAWTYRFEYQSNLSYLWGWGVEVEKGGGEGERSRDRRGEGERRRETRRQGEGKRGGGKVSAPPSLRTDFCFFSWVTIITGSLLTHFGCNALRHCCQLIHDCFLSTNSSSLFSRLHFLYVLRLHIFLYFHLLLQTCFNYYI